jgi:hypothetical protein
MKIIDWRIFVTLFILSLFWTPISAIDIGKPKSGIYMLIDDDCLLANRLLSYSFLLSVKKEPNYRFDFEINLQSVFSQN